MTNGEALHLAHTNAFNLSEKAIKNSKKKKGSK